MLACEAAGDPDHRIRLVYSDVNTSRLGRRCSRLNISRAIYIKAPDFSEHLAHGTFGLQRIATSELGVNLLYKIYVVFELAVLAIDSRSSGA